MSGRHEMRAQSDRHALCCMLMNACTQRILIEACSAAAPGCVLCRPNFSAAGASKHTLVCLRCVKNNPWATG